MLGKVKLLLGLKDDPKDDDLLSYLLETTVEKILAYCHRTQLPTELENVAVEITTKRYRSQQADVNQDKAVKSVTVGGIRTEFADSKAGGGIDQFIDSYRQQLNRFRKVRVR